MLRKFGSNAKLTAFAAWLLLTAGLASAGTFGRVVSIGGQASDLALDEARGVLYVANFTANRIEVMSLGDGSIQTSINVAAQPASIGLSPDGRYLVVGHFGNFASTAQSSSANAITVIELDSRTRQTYATRSPVLALSFGNDGRALVVTPVDFQLFDPVTGVFQILDTITNLTANTLPASLNNAPPSVVAASMATTADGRRIFGLTDAFVFRYEVAGKVVSVQNYISDPTMGPRAISAARDGSYYMGGWVMTNSDGHNISQLPDVQGALDFGTNAIDSDRGVVYSQYARSSLGPLISQKPILQVMDAPNLRVREKLQLPEPLAGKSVLNSDGSIMYAASASGVVILPVGSLDRVPRVVATEEEIVIRGNFCDRRASSQDIAIVSPGGIPADFTLVSNTAGVRVTPSAGVTPATVRITVDPAFFQNLKGTVTATIEVKSNAAVNIPASIRVVVNNREPDQRGTMVNVPGFLVDVLPDPARDRFYMLRQDTNEVLVYDGTNYGLITRMSTANTPTQMAVTFDRRYLLVGHENAQIVGVYDLETLEQQAPVIMPRGHYPRSVATSGKAILAGSRFGGSAVIDRIDLGSRSAILLPSLGVYQNQLNAGIALVGSPNGARIMAAMQNGDVMLYDANADTFTVSRKIADKLSGAYAASSFDQFVVGSTLLNASLVPVKTLDGTATTKTAGFAFVDQTGFRLTSEQAAASTVSGVVTSPFPNANNPNPRPVTNTNAPDPPSVLPAGVIQRTDLASGSGQRATRIAEAPFQGTEQFPFTRTLAPLYSRTGIVMLTVSGFTVVPWNYDALVAIPQITRVTNAADGSGSVATGGLVSITGRNLNPTNAVSREMPLPTALGESCLTVNGVPTPVLFVSPTQINAQIPFNVEGNTTLVLRTPGGVSDNYNLVVRSAAPAVFRGQGEAEGVPTVVRARNNELVTLSNPVHRGDTISIYLTGMGKTAPEVEAGVPGPSNPPAVALTQPDVSIAGFPLDVIFAGMAPGQVGVYVINANVPRGTPLGLELPLKVDQGSGSATVNVRVVE